MKWATVYLWSRNKLLRWSGFLVWASVILLITSMASVIAGQSVGRGWTTFALIATMVYVLLSSQRWADASRLEIEAPPVIDWWKRPLKDFRSTPYLYMWFSILLAWLSGWITASAWIGAMGAKAAAGTFLLCYFLAWILSSFLARSRGKENAA